MFVLIHFFHTLKVLTIEVSILEEVAVIEWKANL